MRSKSAPGSPGRPRAPRPRIRTGRATSTLVHGERDAPRWIDERLRETRSRFASLCNDSRHRARSTGSASPPVVTRHGSLPRELPARAARPKARRAETTRRDRRAQKTLRESPYACVFAAKRLAPHRSKDEERKIVTTRRARAARRPNKNSRCTRADPRAPERVNHGTCARDSSLGRAAVRPKLQGEIT